MSWAVESVAKSEAAHGEVHLVETPSKSEILSRFESDAVLVAELPQPGQALRGRLALLIEGAIEDALERRGAAPPGVGASTDLDASLSDQLYRARLVGARGIAIVFRALDGIANLAGALDAEDSAVLRWWIAAADERPVHLVLDSRDRYLGVYAAPTTLHVLLSRRVSETARREATTEPAPCGDAHRETAPPDDVHVETAPESVESAEPTESVESAEPTESVESVPLADSVEPAPLANSVEPAPLPDSVEPAPLADSVEPAALANSVEPAALANSVEPAPLADSVESVPLADSVEPAPLPDSVEPAALANSVEPAPLADSVEPSPPADSVESEASAEAIVSAAIEPPVEEPAEAEPSVGELPSTEPTPVEAPSAGPNSVEPPPAEAPIAEPSRAQTATAEPDPAVVAACREYVLRLEEAHGPKSLAAVERMFVSAYVPLSEAVANGYHDREAVRALSRWSQSFARSYKDAFDALKLRGKRPTMVLDAPEIAHRIGRLHGARAVQLVLVDGLRFDLGLRVQARLKPLLGQHAVLTERMLLWAALPATTAVQLELLGRGPNGLVEPITASDVEVPVARGRAATTLRRIRTGSRELMKLDSVESRLNEPGSAEPVRLDEIAQDTAEALAAHLLRLPARTLVLVFGDHGFVLEPQGAGTGPVRHGGGSPDEVLVPAFAWLVGGVH